MMTLAAILEALNKRKSKLLDIAQAALPESQFIAYRKLMLDEFGKQGLERDLERIYAEGRTQEQERTGQADTSKKGGAR